jgi:hypothetical protein
VKLDRFGLVLVGTGAGGALWVGFNLLTGVGEPWDHSLFGVAYAIALVGSAILGAFALSSAWIAGVAIVFAMLPVMAMFAGIGPLIAVGIIFLLGLSGPAAVSAWGGWYLAKRITG